MSGTRLPLVLTVLVLVGGSYVRLVQLDQAHFNGDELDHYYAAVSLNEGDEPRLPSGLIYDRGIDITRLVSVTLRFVEPDELAARLPAAMFGIMSLVLMAAIAWSLGGAWAAVWATLLLAIYPEAIIQSRMTRFYTYQLCFGLIAMYSGWRALKGAGRAAEPSRSEWRSSWIWGLVAIIAFALAARVQVTTFSVVLGWLTCILVAAVADVRARRQAWRRSFSIQAVTLGVLLAVIVAVGFSDFIPQMLGKSQYVPAWSGPGKLFAYYYSLSNDFPLVVSLLPLIFLIVFFRKLRLALYLGIWFSVPVLLHSLAFPWKGARYILLAQPALFLAAGIAASIAFGVLYRWLTQQLERKGFGHQRSRRMAGTLATGVFVFAVLTTNAFNRARRIPPIPKPIDWRAAHSIMDSIPDSSDLPVGSSMGLPALYYWGDLDFVVGTDFLEIRSPDSGRAHYSPDGTPDWYSGAPTLTRPESITSRFPEARRILIGIDADRWQFDNIDHELRQALIADGRELCNGRCGAFLLYLWTPLGEEAEDPGAHSRAGTSGERVTASLHQP